MKYFVLILSLAFAHPTADTEIGFGTVAVVDYSQDEVTIGADSRMTTSSGETADTECKISAFGSRFAFVMAGAVKGARWDAHLIAREVWEEDSKKVSTAPELVQLVSEQWALRMEHIYRRPEVLSNIRKRKTEDPVIANAAFAATDLSGNLVLRAMNIDFDPDNSRLRVFHKSQDMSHIGSLTMGRDEVAAEFLDQSSPRAKQLMAAFIAQIRTLSPSERRAAFVSKLVELSIQLHPQNSELAFPIDVLQLRRTEGVHWVSVKPNCALR